MERASDVASQKVQGSSIRLQLVSYGVAVLGVGLIVASCWVAALNGPLVVTLPLLTASMAAVVAFAVVASRAWPTKPQAPAWPYASPDTRRAYGLGTINGVGMGLIFGGMAANFARELGNNGKLVPAALSFLAAACFVVVWRRTRRNKSPSVGATP